MVSIGALYKASEAVALLDLLWSFAHASICELPSFTIPAVVLFVYIVRNYGEFHALTSIAHLRGFVVRPEFTGTLAIKGGRHPVLECVQSAGATIPNDVYCCEASSFQIVQGPKLVLILSLPSHDADPVCSQHVGQKYLFTADRPFDSDGYVRLFHPSRIRILQVCRRMLLQ